MCSAVEGEIIPKCWALNRWLGSEDGLEFCGFWLACGGLFIVGVLVGWLKMKVSDVEGVVVEYMRGAVPVQVAEEVGFDECTKEMSDFERQTTYRRNVQLWLKTVPLPRMWVLKSLVNTQQTHQKELLKTSGLPFEREQLRREAEGMPRKLKPLIALQMEITGPTLKKYGKLMVDAGQWNHLPAECKIQSFAMSGFRCAAKSAATLYRTEAVKKKGPILSCPSVLQLTQSQWLVAMPRRSCTIGRTSRVLWIRGVTRSRVRCPPWHCR